jgi:hypothetical protein
MEVKTDIALKQDFGPVLVMERKKGKRSLQFIQERPAIF